MITKMENTTKFFILKSINMKQTLKVAFTWFIPLTMSIAQNGAVSSGGNFEGSAGESISFTIGQSFYLSLDTEEYLLTQGMQQSYRLNTVATEGFDPGSLLVEIFPNPTKDRLIIKQSVLNNEPLQYTLYNLEGKKLTHGDLAESDQSIYLGNYPGNLFLLQITDNTTKSATYKIVKY